MESQVQALNALVPNAPADSDRRAPESEPRADDGFGERLRRVLAGRDGDQPAKTAKPAERPDGAAEGQPADAEEIDYDPAPISDPAAIQDTAVALLASQPAPVPIVAVVAPDAADPAAAEALANADDFAPLVVPGLGETAAPKPPTTRIQPEFAPASEVAAMAVRITTRTLAAAPTPTPAAAPALSATPAAPDAAALPVDPSTLAAAAPASTPAAPVVAAAPTRAPGPIKPAIATPATGATAPVAEPESPAAAEVAAAEVVAAKPTARPRPAGDAGEAAPVAGEPAPSRAEAPSAQPAEPTVRGNAVERAIANQVERALLRADHGSGGRMLVLRMTPPELGTVRIEVSERAGQLTARVHAEDAAVRVAIERFLPQIRQDLRSYDAPIRDVVLADAWNRDSQQQPGGQRRQNRRDHAAEFGLTGAEALAIGAAPYARALGGLVDADAVDARA